MKVNEVIPTLIACICFIIFLLVLFIKSLLSIISDLKRVLNRDKSSFSNDLNFKITRISDLILKILNGFFLAISGTILVFGIKNIVGYILKLF